MVGTLSETRRYVRTFVRRNGKFTRFVRETTLGQNFPVVTESSNATVKMKLKRC